MDLAASFLRGGNDRELITRRPFSPPASLKGGHHAASVRICRVPRSVVADQLADDCRASIDRGHGKAAGVYST
jgi:hypothetical protein